MLVNVRSHWFCQSAGQSRQMNNCFLALISDGTLPLMFACSATQSEDDKAIRVRTSSFSSPRLPLQRLEDSVESEAHWPSARIINDDCKKYSG